MSFPFPVVLFDFDGTLADGYLAIAASANELRRGQSLMPLTVEEIRPLVGLGIEVLVKKIAPAGDIDENVAIYREHYGRTMLAGTRLFPATVQLLEDLHASGRRMGVCSNKLSTYTSRLLEQLGVAGYFGAVLGPEHVQRPKPAPDMLLEAAQRLGGPPKECLYVGDMAVDVAAGRAAGMTTWVVATGSQSVGELEDAGPDRLFLDLVELHAELFRGGACTGAAGSLA